MSDITIERKNGYWEARNAWAKYRSTNGYDWMKPSGGIIEDNRLEELRFAFFAHLDTTAEPQRAKVGDLVRVLNTHFCERLHGKEVLVRRVDDDGDAWVDDTLDGQYGKAGVCVELQSYTIVPEPVPAPEPKTYTGNPKDWGKGVYTNESGVVVVIVDRLGNSVGFEKPGVFLNSDWDYIGTYHRISTDPAAAVRKCFEAISGKGWE